MFHNKIKKYALRMLLAAFWTMILSLQVEASEKIIDEQTPAVSERTLDVITDNYIEMVLEVEKKTLPFIWIDGEEIGRNVELGQQLEYEEINTILKAKRTWTELLNNEGRVLNLNQLSKSTEFTSLKTVITLANLQDIQIDLQLHHSLFKLHKKNREKLNSDKRKVVIQGAGPCGLLAGIKSYLEGMDVTIVEKRSGDYTRRQIVSLDPLWVAELQWLLGTEFNNLISEGHGQMTADNVLEVSISELERVLKGRILDMIDYHMGNDNTPSLKLLYNTELTKIKKPLQSGYNFRARVINKKTLLEKDLPFDIVVFAGGASDRVREKYLDMAIPHTRPIDYTVAIWNKRYVKGQVSRQRKNYSAGLSTTKYRNFLAGTYKKLGEDLIDSYAIQMDVKHRLLAILSQVHWDENVDFREFDNRHQIYIGAELPSTLSYLRERLTGLINDTVDSDQKSELENFLKTVDKSTLRIIATMWEISEKEFRIDKRSSATFTLVQRAVRLPARIVRLKDSQAIFSVVGDDMVSPHFFSGTGLTSGRDSVNNLVKAIRMQARHNTFDLEVLGSLVRNQNKVISYALSRGKEYVPGVLPLEVSSYRRSKIIELVNKDLASNPDKLEKETAYRLIKEDNNTYKISYNDVQGKAMSVPFCISQRGEIIVQSNEEIENSEMNYWMFMQSMGLKPRKSLNYDL